MGHLEPGWATAWTHLGPVLLGQTRQSALCRAPRLAASPPASPGRPVPRAGAEAACFPPPFWPPLRPLGPALTPVLGLGSVWAGVFCFPCRARVSACLPASPPSPGGSCAGECAPPPWSPPHGSGAPLTQCAPAPCRYLASRSKRHTLAMTSPTAEVPPDLQRQLGQQPFRPRAPHLAPDQYR